ncbi:MAG: Ig-like domain-containing protein [Acidobacteriaceae bacterium]
MGPTPSAVASVAPTISPASGPQTFPLTVTLTDPGYTSGPQPLANTGIWYTTDGSTPVPGSGTAQRLDSGGTVTLNAAATVKAVGMWGSSNQPSSYPAGFGFVPSNVVTATYSASGAIKRPAGTANSSNGPSAKMAAAAGAGAASATLVSVAITPSQPVVAIGSTTQLKATATFGDGSVKDVTADFGWQSSDARTMTATGSGMLAGIASGKATISGVYGGLQASVPANSAIGDVAWSDPIVITKGGIYSGNWQSTDVGTPAVTVATTAPVIIENAHLRSAGGLIKTSVAGADLTVRNSVGVAVSAPVKGQPNGVFLEAGSPARLDVENNYVENARGGVIVQGYAGKRDGEPTIVIRGNRARNLNGMLSNGNGGYLPAEGANHTQARFIQFDGVQAVPGIDVGWNEVINYPGHSLIEENIDIYRSGGTANQPLEIHDTYIQGAYPYKAAQDAYTGGGIKTDAKAGDNAQVVPAFNSIHDNQVVATTHYGIEFAAGHDNVAANNRVISSGLLADGTKITSQLVGMANGDGSGAGVADGTMYNNTMRDNLIGWTCWQSSCAQEGYRNDRFFPAAPADYSTNSVVAARQITLDMENNEYQVWQNKMASSGITVGPSF